LTNPDEPAAAPSTVPDPQPPITPEREAAVPTAVAEPEEVSAAPVMAPPSPWSSESIAEPASSEAAAPVSSETPVSAQSTVAAASFPALADDPDAGRPATPAPDTGSRERESHRDAGPNWMLAFVCAVAGLTSLFEARSLYVQLVLGPMVRWDLAIPGYFILGLGLLAFAVDALFWGRRRGGAALLLTAAPALLTLIGIALLLLSHHPGRRI
jgi:hypothetical protein